MSDQLVTVATYRNAFEAHAARNLLDENGIRAFLADENFANLNYAIPVDAKIQVTPADADEARKLLSTTPSPDTPSAHSPSV
jgi:hypothetical protein